MIRISQADYRSRLERLESAVAEAELEIFLVSSFDSIYYLTGAGFEPLERPFFLAVYPRGSPATDPPGPQARRRAHEEGRGTSRRWRSGPTGSIPRPTAGGGSTGYGRLIGSARRVGIEPSLRRDIADELRDLTVDCRPARRGAPRGQVPG